MNLTTIRNTLHGLLGLLGASICSTVLAGPQVNLQANARSMLPNDEMLVQMAIERSGTDIGQLNDQVLNALNEALTSAKSHRGVQSRLGNVHTQQNYNAQGKPQGFTVRGEIALEGRDLKSVGELAGRLSQRLQLVGVSFRLAESSRAAEEQRLLKEAARNFANRAKDVAAAFGFGNFEYKQMTVQTSGAVGPSPRPMAAMARGVMADQAIPSESAGESSVSVNVSGAIELK